MSERVALRLVLPGVVVIPEGVGRCQVGFRPVVLRRCRLFQGMVAWPHGCFLLTAAVSCEPAVRVRDRAFGPAAVGGAAGVLDASAGEPTIGWPGESPPGLGGLWSYARPIAGLVRRGSPLAAVIPSGVPRPGGPGGMGRSASGPGGVNHNHVRAAVPVTLGGVPVRAGGQTTKRPRARPGRRLMPPGWRRGGRARRARRRRSR